MMWRSQRLTREGGLVKGVDRIVCLLTESLPSSQRDVECTHIAVDNELDSSTPAMGRHRLCHLAACPPSRNASQPPEVVE